METIKKGSKGEAVKTLQRLLGITADGVFGNGTENCVKAFQRSHNLVPDGVVGSSTWNVLLAGTNKSDIDIIQKPIKSHITRASGRSLKYIAIHYTAGSSSTAGNAEKNRNVFINRSASADFVVDDACIIQVNPDIRNYYCWAVGDKKNPYSSGGKLYGVATNKNTISIEICSNLYKGFSATVANHNGWYFSDASLNNAVKLVKYLMKTYGIPKSNVIRHYDVTGKLCPAIVGWNNETLYGNDGKPIGMKNNSSKWEAFLRRI